MTTEGSWSPGPDKFIGEAFDKLNVALERVDRAIGRGTVYKVLGASVLAGLGLTVGLGLAGVVSPGFFAPQVAFTMVGLALVIISAAVLSMAFFLTRTIRFLNREVHDLTRLRGLIRSSYTRLSDATENLGREVERLRRVVPELKPSTTAATEEKARATLFPIAPAR